MQTVAITDVDVANRKATGYTRYQTYVSIDTSHHVGAVQVTPSFGEQWSIAMVGGIWMLVAKKPFNTAEMLNSPAEGQTQIGSSAGPTELNGGQVNVNAPMATQAVATTARPAASSVPAGTQIYDSTLNKPIWSNGTIWHDAAGTAV
jgi:hypothetical protein